MKIIALDLDDTLLKSDLTISKRTIDTLKKCKDLGNIIVINTARSLVAVRQIAKEIGADYINLECGNLIVDKDENTLYQNQFNKDTLKEMIDFFFKYSEKVYLGTKNQFLGEIFDLAFAERWGVVDTNVRSLTNIDAYKCAVCYEKEENIPLFNEFCDRHNLCYFYMRTAPYLIINPPESNKWNGLKMLCKILNVSTDDLYVFGDDTSDLLSLKNAGKGIAMANAKDEVLKEIKTTTLSNNEDGVAAYIEEYIL